MTFADQVANLQKASNWKDIELALTTQRDDLVTANQAAIANAVDVFRTERDAARVSLAESEATKNSLQSSKSDSEARLSAILIADDKDAAIAAAMQSESEKKAAILSAEIKAKQDELSKLSEAMSVK